LKDKNVEKTLDNVLIKGSELVGLLYEPPFDYFFNDKKIKNHVNGWKVYGASFVTMQDGTGIVHIAPAFGDDDLGLCFLPSMCCRCWHRNGGRSYCPQGAAASLQSPVPNLSLMPSKG
jgi:isoleucyl-tRNA synthetase